MKYIKILIILILCLIYGIIQALNNLTFKVVLVYAFAPLIIAITISIIVEVVNLLLKKKLSFESVLNRLWRVFLIIIIILFISIGLSHFTSSAKANEYIELNKPPIQQLDYKSIKIGSSNLYIKLPWELTRSSLNVPKILTENIVKYEVFAFSRDKTFEGKVAYLLWKEGYGVSLKSSIDDAIENMRKLSGVEKVVETRDYFTKEKIEGCIFDCVIYRYGKSFEAKGIHLKSGQQSWGVVITFTEHKDKPIANEIISSLK